MCYSAIEWSVFDTSAKALNFWVRQSQCDPVVTHTLIQVGRYRRRLQSPTSCSTQGQLRHPSRLLRAVHSPQLHLILTPSSPVAIFFAYKHAAVNSTGMYISQSQNNLQEKDNVLKDGNTRHFFARQWCCCFCCGFWVFLGFFFVTVKNYSLPLA